MRKGASLLERIQTARERRSDSIVRKCHPIVFELAPLYKEAVQAADGLHQTMTPELLQTIREKFTKQVGDIFAKYPDLEKHLPEKAIETSIHSDAAFENDAQGFVEALHWHRHRVPLKTDMRKIAQKNWEASCRAMRTERDFLQLQCGKTPIQPFKNDIEHAAMFEIFWDFGMADLTPEELADFFDMYCPDGHNHEPDGLKRQRARFEKDLIAATAATSK
jgi:hypothetical protein